ncbi:MAG: pseudouridine synthase [Bacteroidota bacterium]
MNPSIHHHYKLYKPYGYVSQFVSRQYKSHKKKFLGEFFDFHPDTMSVGRLDENSEGLLLLTTNGKLSHTINSARIEKEYYAQVDGIITSEAILKMQKGVLLSIEGKLYRTKPCKARIIDTPQLPETKQRIRHERHGPTSWVSITLREGKFRQVRKMTAAVGFPTLRLARYRVGNYTIENMQSGDCISLDELLP